ncbi:MAG: tetratricopeptide repeat protein [Pirellulaceae bacterium]|nr:tetratricopeptide repeat protein [Pirellulaceae bacterium]
MENIGRLHQDSASPLAGKRIAFVGKLGGMTRREAMQLVREHGGVPVERSTSEVDLIVIGAEQLPVDATEAKLHESIRDLASTGQIEIIAESELWERLGLVEQEQHVKQLYTPAMLADLLKVTISTVRRWHRMGLIQPVHVVHRLPYFDFQEVQTARQLARWIDDGAKPAAIQRQMDLFAQWLPSGSRSLAQLDIILEGRNLLLRKGEGLIEADGQLRMDFEAFEEKLDEGLETEPSVLSLADHQLKLDGFESSEPELSQAAMLDRAQLLEGEGHLREAIEWYRVVLAKYGPTAELHFQLAELLYREGEIEAARERYYAAIEIDEVYVEARANLGCVLQETGRTDLAIAAFRGALALYEEYADVHYHLARVLDEIGHRAEAIEHWNRFTQLAPQSPWIGEAQDRLAEEIHS